MSLFAPPHQVKSPTWGNTSGINPELESPCIQINKYKEDFITTVPIFNASQDNKERQGQTGSLQVPHLTVEGSFLNSSQLYITVRNYIFILYIIV